MLHHPAIDPVALHLGPLAIRWYGLMYLVGFAAAWWLGRRRAQRPGSGWQASELGDLIFYCAMGAVLGGRIGYVLFYQPAYYLSHPAAILQAWEGGMSFHGGLIGVLLACWLFGRKTGRGFFTVTDFAAPLVPTGLLAGRLGNFINGELWGRVTDLPWGMVFEGAGAAAAPSIAALSGGARRRAAVRHPVAVFGPATAGDGGVRGVSDRLRHAAFHR